MSALDDARAARTVLLAELRRAIGDGIEPGKRSDLSRIVGRLEAAIAMADRLRGTPCEHLRPLVLDGTMYTSQDAGTVMVIDRWHGRSISARRVEACPDCGAVRGTYSFAGAETPWQSPPYLAGGFVEAIERLAGPRRSR